MPGTQLTQVTSTWGEGPRWNSAFLREQRVQGGTRLSWERAEPPCLPETGLCYKTCDHCNLGWAGLFGGPNQSCHWWPTLRPLSPPRAKEDSAVTALNWGQPRSLLMARRFQKPSGASADSTGLYPYLEGGGERSLVQPSSATYRPSKLHSDLAWSISSSARPSRNRQHGTELRAPWTAFPDTNLCLTIEESTRYPLQKRG